MWYPAKIVEEAQDSPVTADEVKLRLRIDDTDDADDIELLIESATDFVEKYCNTRLATQTVEMKCDRFYDFGRLPEAPIQSVDSIVYVDATGVEQTLPDTVYEPRTDGLETSIVLKRGQSWPAMQTGSRITVTAVVGYEDVPPAVKHAVLLVIGDGYKERESTDLPAGARALPGALWVAGWSSIDTLLANYRRGI